MVLGAAVVLGCAGEPFEAEQGTLAGRQDAAFDAGSSGSANGPDGSLPDSSTTGSPDATNRTEAGTGGGTLDATFDAAETGPDVIYVDAGCDAPLAWYPDVDGDGVGRSSGGVVTCETPGDDWSQISGDCNDDNPAVHPDQTDYFAEPYVGSGGEVSFDYDCNGEEDGDPAQLGPAPNCGGTSLVNCKGTGFVPTDRSGPPRNSVCGSKTLRTCTPEAALFCSSNDQPAEAPKRCR